MFEEGDIEFASYHTTELEIRSDGKLAVHVDLMASSTDAAEASIEILEQVTGGTLETGSDSDRGSSRSFFGLNSKNWRGSTWEPKGPDQKMGGYKPPEVNLN